MSWLTKIFRRSEPVVFCDDNVLRLRATTITPPEPRKAQVFEFRKNARGFMAMRKPRKPQLEKA